MPLKIGLAQINTTMGDFEHNAHKIHDFYLSAIEKDVDLLVFPELAVCGYPPEDLLLKKHFLQENHRAVEKIALRCPDITLVLGFAENYFDKCYNSLALTRNGTILRTYRKHLLPNYGVFDEQRYFHKGNDPLVLDIKDISAAMTICEDIWEIDYLSNVLEHTPKHQILINISGSPFNVGKIDQRRSVQTKAATGLKTAIAYCNLIGGQDELVFDGQSLFMDQYGHIITKAPAFKEEMLIAEVDSNGTITPISGYTEQTLEIIEEIRLALITGTRDYVRKNGFERVVIGLSGGIDSAVTAAIAAQALGAENVIGVTMPSRFNLEETKSDARKLAENLNIEFHTVAIEDTLGAFDKALSNIPGWNQSGLAYENLQSRLRGNLLMSISNQLNCLVLTTGNKSETAVGYSTLYGDTAGGFAVIKDLPKTMVYELASHINKQAGNDIIPQSIIDRIPSAELRADQKDTDSLPPYDVLDKILKEYVEHDQSADEITKQGLPANIVNKVIKMVDRNEYKRRQSPPGVKITPKAFGRDRRLPITNKYITQTPNNNNG